MGAVILLEHLYYSLEETVPGGDLLHGAVLEEISSRARGPQFCVSSRERPVEDTPSVEETITQ